MFLRPETPETEMIRLSEPNLNVFATLRTMLSGIASMRAGTKF